MFGATTRKTLHDAIALVKLAHNRMAALETTVAALQPQLTQFKLELDALRSQVSRVNTPARFTLLDPNREGLTDEHVD